MIYDEPSSGHSRSPVWRKVSSGDVPLPIALASMATLVLLAGTFWLWTNIGATIFFETIRTGFPLCG